MVLVVYKQKMLVMQGEKIVIFQNRICNYLFNICLSKQPNKHNQVRY